MKFFCSLALLFISTTMFSQSFSFRYFEEETKIAKENADFIEEHYLGFYIAQKMQLLKESYTYTEPPTATNPTPRTVVEKPAIYYSVKKVDNYLKRQIKSGDMSNDDALKIMDSVLKVALNVRNQETAKLEEILWNIKSQEEEIVNLYTTRIALNLN